MGGGSAAGSGGAAATLAGMTNVRVRIDRHVRPRHRDGLHDVGGFARHKLRLHVAVRFPVTNTQTASRFLHDARDRVTQESEIVPPGLCRRMPAIPLPAFPRPAMGIGDTGNEICLAP
jgi:hypothetical protein